MTARPYFWEGLDVDDLPPLDWALLENEDYENRPFWADEEDD